MVYAKTPLSTQTAKTLSQARISQAYENLRWPQVIKAPPTGRPPKVVSLKLMLPAAHRLPSNLAATLSKYGRVVMCHGLRLVYQKNQQNRSRFMVVAGKQVSRLATERNRTKRLLHEALFRLVTQEVIPIDAILQARINLADQKFNAVLKRVGDLLHEAGRSTRSSEPPNHETVTA